MTKIIKKMNFKNYFLITCGVFLVALGCNCFIIPLQISSGGVTGIGLTLNYFFNIPIAVVVYIINIALLILAYFTIDKTIFYRSVFGSLLFPFFLFVIPEVAMIPADPLLAVIIAGVVMGTGFGIVFMYGGSTGGTSIVPYFLKKYFKLPMALGFFLCDAIIISLNILTGNYVAIFYGLVCIAIANIVTDYFQNGFSKKKSVYIISEKNDKIQVYIHQEVNRGTTLINGIGGYSKEAKQILLTIVSNRELQKIREFVLSIDESAFIIIGSVTEVHGNGFTLAQK